MAFFIVTTMKTSNLTIRRIVHYNECMPDDDDDIMMVMATKMTTMTTATAVSFTQIRVLNKRTENENLYIYIKYN
jgi:hypothetical protein